MTCKWTNENLVELIVLTFWCHLTLILWYRLVGKRSENKQMVSYCLRDEENVDNRWSKEEHSRFALFCGLGGDGLEGLLYGG